MNAEYVTNIYATAVWVGIALIFAVALLDWNQTALKVALIGTLCMAGHHYAQANMGELMREHRAPYIEDKGPELEYWKAYCPIALVQEEGACLATAIAQAVMIEPMGVCDGVPKELNARAIADNIDAMIDRTSISDALKVASELGYITEAIKIESFDIYKDFITHYPILIAHEMTEGMVDTSRSSNGFIEGHGEVLYDSEGKVKKHAALLLGRNPRWFNGRYSTYKDSSGPRGGERFGESKITDKELKALFVREGTEVWAIVK
jgi:hypothetical protein